jgi:hypothetical protein
VGQELAFAYYSPCAGTWSMPKQCCCCRCRVVIWGCARVWHLCKPLLRYLMQMEVVASGEWSRMRAARAGVGGGWRVRAAALALQYGCQVSWR